MLLLILRFALLGQMMFAPAPPPADSAPADQATAPAAPATTQPTTQQQQQQEPPNGAQTNDGNVTLVERFNATSLGQLVSGKKNVNLQDVLQFQFWSETIRDLILFALSAIPRVLVALLFLAVFWVIYRGIRRLAVGSMAKAHVDQSIRDMLGALIKWSIMGFGLVIAFNQIGVQITALLTGVSIIGLAIGFAAQETLANFIAGVVIFWDKPFKVGDWVEIDGQFGQVLRITFRSTRILTLDGEVVILPNVFMLSNKLSNHSTNPINRVTVRIGIAYKESIDAARQVLIKLVERDPRICADPPPDIVVESCGASSVDLAIRFWIADEAIERRLGYEVLEKAKKALDAANIQIPYPHLQLFMEKTPALDALTAATASAGGAGVKAA